MSRPPAPGTAIQLLDCTIRDGSYAIDFKFTPSDSALVAGVLDGLGIPYIEVGHGLGLGAGTVGTGSARDRDEREIVRAREAVSHGRLGAFFIPGIGDLDDLAAGATSGLDFVRIGQNADEIDDVWGHVERAQALGLEVFVNLMKTYGIDPPAFAETAARAHELGVAGVYVVDSAGGMLPEEVAAYVSAARDRCDMRIGFHGHSNLQLGVANALRALEAGATLVDTSLYGIGRSSGNVPTEVFVAVLQRLGIDVGIDPLDVIEAAERYLQPLAEHLHPHTMLAVSLGLGRFHSSYLPRALDAAEQAGVSPYRLIVELGRRDPMRLSDALLAEVLAELGDAPAQAGDAALARFSHPAFGPQRIRRDATAVGELVEGLEAVAAKRRLAVVLDLVASRADEESVSAEFVLEDRFMALGRLRFGSDETLESALEDVAGRVDLGLLQIESRPQGPWALDLAGGPQLLPYRSDELVLGYLGEVALRLAVIAGAKPLVADPGHFARPDVDALARRLGSFPPVPLEEITEGELVVVAGPLSEQAADRLRAERTVCVEVSRLRRLHPDERVLRLAADDAYRGRLPAWRQALGAAAGIDVGVAAP